MRYIQQSTQLTLCRHTAGAAPAAGFWPTPSPTPFPALSGLGTLAAILPGSELVLTPSCFPRSPARGRPGASRVVFLVLFLVRIRLVRAASVVRPPSLGTRRCHFQDSRAVLSCTSREIRAALRPPARRPRAVAHLCCRKRDRRARSARRPCAGAGRRGRPRMRRARWPRRAPLRLVQRIGLSYTGVGDKRHVDGGPGKGTVHICIWPGKCVH